MLILTSSRKLMGDSVSGLLTKGDRLGRGGDQDAAVVFQVATKASQVDASLQSPT
jgi:hypothetical protein